HIFDSRRLMKAAEKRQVSGNPLPLFWHCRFAGARKAPVYGVFGNGTALALAVVRTFWSPKGFRHEHQLR
ncbi:hypothetical protein ACEI36_27140, partial [Pseudomonas kielensis]|uniref:hypothetical protein n=1 Tax=Pseudomonas kielensis TaxID=2762577 RepID=UPI00389F9FAF